MRKLAALVEIDEDKGKHKHKQRLFAVGPR